MRSAREFLRRWKYLFVSLGLVAYFNAGAEWIREEKARLSSAPDMAARIKRLLWPPWRAAQLYVSHDSDEHLFFENTRLILGEQADLNFIAQQSLGDVSAVLADLRYRTQGPAHMRLPYRDVVISYPPVGIAVMLLPRLVASTLAGYRMAFGVLMGAFFLLSLWIGIRISERLQEPGNISGEIKSNERSAITEHWMARGAAMLACIGPTLIMRYDIVPALLCAAVVLCLIERRALLATVCILVGAAAKMYPLLLLPTWLALLFGLGQTARRTAVRVVAQLAAISIGAVTAALLLVRGDLPLLHDVLVFQARPFQLESVLGSLLVAISGASAIMASFGSFNVDTPLARLLAPYWDFGMAAALLAVAALAFRWARRHRQLGPAAQGRALVAWTVAALLVLLCATKVLSAQYVIWCVPLIAALPGRRGQTIFRLFLPTLFLTQLIYPTLYGALIRGSTAVLAVLLLRNVLLGAVAVLAVRNALEAAD